MSIPEYLTVAECAARLRVSPSLVRQRIRAGVIPTSPLTGRAIRIPASALDAVTATTTAARDRAAGEDQTEEVVQEVDGMSGIYIASRVHHAPTWLTCRDIDGVPIISTWINEAGEGQTADVGGLWARIATEIASANALVFYAAIADIPLKGALVEAGMAIALGKPVIAVIDASITLDARSYRPIGSWLAHPLVRIVGSLREAFGLAESLPALRPHPIQRGTEDGGNHRRRPR